MRTFVLGDLHLACHSPPQLGVDFAALLQRHAGQRVIVAGDFFDLVAESPTAQPQAISRVLDAHPPARAAMGRFLDGGGELMLTGGNHDAAIASETMRAAILRTVQPATEARCNLQTTPWFLREQEVHIEHGHFYDPDNTPAHPLVNGTASLGVHFSARFVQPTGAHRYLLNNDATPLELLLSAFSWYGARGPYVVYRYFRAAFEALAMAGPFHHPEAEQRLGQRRLARWAEESGLSTELADAVLQSGARSTLQSWAATFARLYMDRVLATLLISSGLGGAILGRGQQRRIGARAATLGSLLMVVSWLRGHNRYRGNVAEQLACAAKRIVETCGAKLVVFAHSHREASGDRYANTGAFAFPRRAPGRPYLEIHHDSATPTAERHYG